MIIKLKNKNLFFLHESDLNTSPFRKLNTQLPDGDVPAAPPAPGEIPIKEIPPPADTGAISVGVFTASRALPVQDAVVTVYHIGNGEEEHVLAHLVTDRNGRIPNVEVPVVYNPADPLESSEYYFSNYNIRVQAINYYTQNILGIRVFPGTTTRFNIDLIPVAAGTTGEEHEQTVVIPPAPVDFSNNGGD